MRVEEREVQSFPLLLAPLYFLYDLSNIFDLNGKAALFLQ